MSRIILTADTHLNHKKMIDFGRPQDFEAQILRNLTKDVMAGDIVIHLGDVCIGDDIAQNSRFFSACAVGDVKAILVLGNHDKKSMAWYYDHGWDFVCDTFSINFMGKRILFSHAPTGETMTYDLNIHGHTHGNSHRLIADEMEFDYDSDFHKELALENTKYRPVLLKSFLEAK